MRVVSRLTAVTGHVVGWSLVVGLSLARPAWGQVGVDDLQAPSSPGFVVLGQEPTAIARPSSPRAVGLSLLSAIAESDTLIPKNYALEVTPFWLASHPALTYDAYTDAGVGQTLLQSFAVSVATATLPDAGDGTVGVGFGARALALKGRPNSNVAPLIAELRQIQDDVLRAATVEEEDRLGVLLQQKALAVQAELRDRVGWVVEVAGAVGAQFQDGAYDSGRVRRFGVWATPTYRWENRLSLLGVARYLRDPGLDTMSRNLFDVGGRVQFQLDDLALSTELVGRLASATDAEDSLRVVGTVDYRINDDLYLTSSFGKNHADPTTGTSGLVTFLGLNLGLSRAPTVRIQ